jgi:hypothetical protein
MKQQMIIYVQAPLVWSCLKAGVGRLRKARPFVKLTSFKDSPSQYKNMVNLN